MALVKCKECGSEISNKAKACPKCGATPPKETSKFTIVVGGFFALIVGMAVFRPSGPPDTPIVAAAPAKPAPSRARHPECAGNPEQEKCDQRLDELAKETPEQKAARVKRLNQAAADAEKAAKALALEEKKAERLAKAKKKKEGVNIGMSKQDVLDSSWGRPSHINRTTTARGTREQWVYDGNYLYFDADTLTSIQN